MQAVTYDATCWLPLRTSYCSCHSLPHTCQLCSVLVIAGALALCSLQLQLVGQLPTAQSCLAVLVEAQVCRQQHPSVEAGQHAS